ncbi:uncharacterized protein LOC114940487 [Nylanderia fulva]|uniref:uncharacterized protein LOC114940487 n=1 Tax=Nylanderia fulva TaxID=613905 RepID=UPI0010FAE9C7|nr:uncharacterized protein LOC114940487 [Nylanderia fulva]
MYLCRLTGDLHPLDILLCIVGDQEESPAVYIGCTDKLTDLTLMDRPWCDVSPTEIGHVGANEISRDDVNVIHIFCIFPQQYVTLPPVRALGKTRKGGKKKKKTPDGEGEK